MRASRAASSRLSLTCQAQKLFIGNDAGSRPISASVASTIARARRTCSTTKSLTMMPSA
jgi:hypothetical protein